MGCNFSTHTRSTPHRPRIKPGKIADIHLPESPKSTSKTTLESPPYLSKPRLTFGPSNSFQVTSPTAYGTLDIVKGDQSMGEAISPPIIIKGLVQVTMGSQNDSKEKSESQDGTPGPDGSSLKRDFTFFGQLQSAGSSYEMNPRQTDRFLSSHRPSAFFGGEKRMSSSSVLKLSTFAGPQAGILPDELLEERKKSITNKSLAASLLIIEQEANPDTPGFKASPPRQSNQLTLDVIKSRGSSRQSEDMGQEEDPKGSLKMFSSKTIQIVPQEQDALESPPPMGHHVKSWPCAPEEASPIAKGNENRGNLKVKARLQRKFTQNLLDLVPVKRNDLSHKKETLETSLSPPMMKKQSSEVNEESSLSLTSAVPPTVEHHRSPPLESSDKGLLRRGSKKLHMIKLRDLEFLNNGEMISPINNMPRQGSPGGNTNSPFSYQASFSKHVLEGSEFLDDKTMTNAENISRVDFDKYSFVAEVKEIEVDDGAILHDNITPYKPIKKSIFNEKRAEPKADSPSIVLAEEEDPEEEEEKKVVVPKLQKSSSLMVDSPNPKRLLKNKTFHDIASAEQDSSSGKGAKSSPFLLSEPSLMKKGKAKSIQVVETMILDKSFDENGFKKINDYTLQHELGRGSFAKVKLGFDYRDGVKVEFAIKIVSRKKIKKKMFTKQKNAFTQLQAEIAIMKKMSHPNIVQLYEVIDAPDEDKMYLIMEYAVKGAVMSKHFWSFEPAVEEDDNQEGSTFKKVRPLDEAKAKKYFRDLILGIHYMHHFVNAIHRDIKPENLLIDEHDVLKIADFNISQMFEKNTNDIVQDDLGTRLYMAPEAWLGASFRGKPADIWAAGATLYYFFYGKPPFPEKFGKNVRDLILQSEPQFPDDKEIDPGAINLIKKCLIKDPEKRITIEKIMEDEWITDSGEHPLSNYEYEPIGATTEEEMKKAVTIKPQTILMITNQLVKSLSTARRNLQILKEEGQFE